MIHQVWSRIASPVPFAALLLALGCSIGVMPRGVPLYANASATPLPRAAVAELTGPIAKVDGRDVIDQGRRHGVDDPDSTIGTGTGCERKVDQSRSHEIRRRNPRVQSMSSA